MMRTRLAFALLLWFALSGAMFRPYGGGGGPPGGSPPPACAASIQSIINATATGGTVQLAGSAASPCTYANQTFTPKANQTIQGDCSSSVGANTILDGSGVSAATPVTNGYTAGVSGVTIQCLTVQHYTGAHTAGCSLNQLVTYDGWLLTKDTFQDAGCDGVDLKGEATLTNSRVTGNGTTGVFSEPGYSAISNAAQTVTGNEIDHNGSSDSVGNNAAGLKSVPSACAESAIATQGTNINYNWVHDNTGVGIWWDCWSAAASAIGNTVIANSAAGIMFEISVGCTIQNNVVKGNGTGSSLFQGDIFIASSSNCSAQNNFVEVSNSFSRNGGPIVQAQCRGDVPQAEVNDNVTNNTVVFDGFTSGQGVVGQIDSTNLGANCGGDNFPAAWTYYFSANNPFQSPATTDPHWTGNAEGYGTHQTLTGIQGSPYSNESGSTIVTSGISIPLGCLAIGCTSSGWPVLQNNKGINKFLASPMQFCDTTDNTTWSGATCPSTSQTSIQQEEAAWSALGIGWIRFPAYGTLDGSCNGSINWGKNGTAGKGIGYDRAIADMLAMNIKPLIVLAQTAACANSSSIAGWYAPTSVSTWVNDFIAAAVTHLSADGVHNYEIWNEPNGNFSWLNLTSGQFAPEYASMLCTAYTKVHAIDSQATVVGGVLTGSYGATILDTTFLTSLYGDAMNPIHGCFDALSDHPYAFNGPTSNYLIGGPLGDDWARMSGQGAVSPSLVSIMAANSDSAKKIWVTEQGCSDNAGSSSGQSYVYCGATSTEPQPGGSINQQQQQVYDMYTGTGRFSQQGPTFWFQEQDSATTACNATTSDPSDNCTGLYTFNGTTLSAKVAEGTYAAQSGMW